MSPNTLGFTYGLSCLRVGSLQKKKEAQVQHRERPAPPVDSIAKGWVAVKEPKVLL